MWLSRGGCSWNRRVAVAAHARSQAAPLRQPGSCATACGCVGTTKRAWSCSKTGTEKKTERISADSERRWDQATEMASPCGRMGCCVQT